MQYKKYTLLALLLITVWACKKWDDHTAVPEQALNEDLMEQISSRPELSLFKDYLIKTGLDKELTASKNYTIWAPVNDALKSIDAAVVNNTDSLRAVLRNHIAGQLYFTRMAADTIRTYMLNGKRIFFYQQHFDAAGIKTADVYVKNGVLHTIDKVIMPLPSVWGFIDATRNTFEQNTYISRLIYQKQDTAIAEVDSINPVTGEVVYKPGTGMVTVNAYLDRVYHLENEDSLYTFFILNNTAYEGEMARMAPYFKSTEALITSHNSSWNVVKDLAIKGLYTKDQLPDTLISRFGVRVPVNKAAITAEHKVSNGIVYEINTVVPPLKDKIPACIVQGETPYAFKGDVISKTFYRLRNNPETGKPFNDMYIQNPGTSFYVMYLSNEVFTAKYKVYWVSLNDYTARTDNDNSSYGTTNPFMQRLAMDSSNNAATFSYVSVAPNTYTETYLGEYTKDSYDFPVALLSESSANTLTPASVRMFLTSATTSPNYLSLDYIKFVPVLE